MKSKAMLYNVSIFCRYSSNLYNSLQKQGRPCPLGDIEAWLALSVGSSVLFGLLPEAEEEFA